MTAFNVVRFRVKSGEEERFIDYHRKAKPGFKGFLGGSIIKTGDQTFCFVAEWKNFQNIIDARPQMIGMLDGIRDALDDLGGELGVTDAVSGTAVLKLAGVKTAKKTAKKAVKKAPGKAPRKKQAAARKKKPARKN